VHSQNCAGRLQPSAWQHEGTEYPAAHKSGAGLAFVLLKWTLHGEICLCVQRYFIRIIILIPNYALCSFFSLAFEGAAVYIQTARDMCAAKHCCLPIIFFMM
jgi:hypothetical protein